jgi:membrane fusion protein (multidrug efflux system)
MKHIAAVFMIVTALASFASAQAAPVKVSSRVSGMVKSVEVKEGAKVVKGSILARLDDDLAKIEVKKAEAELESVRARALEAKRNLDREEVLAKRGLIPPAELEDAQTKSASATGDLRLSEARLEEARLNLRYTEVRSPVSGKVVKKMTYEGQVIRLDVEVVPLFEIAPEK